MMRKMGAGRAGVLVLVLGAWPAACGEDEPVEPPSACQAAVQVQDPGSVTGDTREHEHLAEGTCITGEAPEAYFTVTPATTGMLDITLESQADLGMYARTTCAIFRDEIGCADGGVAGEVETLAVPVTQGEPVWILVDGFDAEDAGAFTLSVKSRAIACGDGLVEGDETCDPPDGGVTCADDCQTVPEKCDDSVDNDLDGLIDCEDAGDCESACPLAGLCGAAPPAAVPSDTGDTSGAPGSFAGSCTGGSLTPEALRVYDPAMTGALLLTLQSATNQGLYVRGDCVDPASELGCLDDLPGGADETLVVPAEAGVPLTIFVDAADPAEVGPFTLLSSLEPATEVEPNDTPMTATDHADPFVAAIWPAGDVDYVRVAVPGPSSTLTATIGDFGNGDCDNFKQDSTLEIFGPDGTTSLVFNDDTGNFCSSAQATDLAAGTYYVRVEASRITMKPTFAYRLALQVN